MSPPSGAVRILIDTDPGLDDLLALAFAVACPELRVAALTSVAGNARLEVVTDNAARFCAWAGLNVPLGRGAAHPLSLSPANAIEFHGADGRRGIALPPGDPGALPSAGQVLRESVGRGGVDRVVALGPLTNLASLVAEEPRLLEGVGIIWMGGSLSAGNVTPVAEFNCYADPEAADIVLRSGLDIRVIGLDVTRCVVFREADLARAAPADSSRGRLLDALLREQMEAERVALGERCAVLHDPAAIAATLDADLFRYEPKGLAVEVTEGPDRGRLTQRDERPPVEYAVEVDHVRLLGLFAERLRCWALENGMSADAL